MTQSDYSEDKFSFYITKDKSLIIRGIGILLVLLGHLGLWKNAGGGWSSPFFNA